MKQEGLFKGRHHSEETKKRLSLIFKGRPAPWIRTSPNIRLFQKGYTPWNKGKRLSPRSEETKRKIGLANKGKKMVITEEMRRKISEALKGKIPTNLTYLHSLPYTEERKRKIGLAHKGMKHTEETRRKISDKKRDPLRPLYRAIRECYKSREWKIAVFKRDKHKCCWCGKKDKTIQADHIKPFWLIVKKNNIKTLTEALECKELWDISNGRTLCEKCHRKTDTWGNRKRNMI